MKKKEEVFAPIVYWTSSNYENSVVYLTVECSNCRRVLKSTTFNNTVDKKLYEDITRKSMNNYCCNCGVRLR